MPPPHPSVPKLVQDVRRGRLSRRDFLAHATALGFAAPLATALAAPPVQAQAQPQPQVPIRRGGTLRVQQSVRALGDPRSFDWSEMANQTRGFLEYLVEYRRDGSFHGMLLENWEVNADATRFLLMLRPNVTWNNGDPFTPRDVIRNLARWCDTSAKGNSMASRLTGLIDPATGQMRAGAAVQEGPLGVAVALSAPDISFIATLSDYPRRDRA